MILHRAVVPLCLVAAVAAGCASPPSVPVPAPPAAATDPFAVALSRVSSTVTGYVEFVDHRVLATGSDAWQPLRGGSVGRLGMYADQLSTRLRIDLGEADWTVTASRGGPSVTLIAGGQDAAAIRSAAQDGGWSGPDVLTRELALTEPLTLQAGTLRPSGRDVVVAGPAAPIGIVDGPGPALGDDPAVAGLQACLGPGPAVVGLVREDAKAPVAAGIRPDPADPARTVNVVCAAHPTASAATARVAALRADVAPGSAQPSGRAFTDPQVEELGGAGNVVRLIGHGAPGTPPSFLLGQMARRALPGGLG